MGGSLTAIDSAATLSAVPRPPTIRGALRAAASDLYYHSIRLVPVNIVFALGVLVVLVVWTGAGPLVGLLAGSVLSVPIAGLARLAALATRGQDVNLSDALHPLRERPLATLGAGGAIVGASAVLGTNLIVGLLTANVVGFALATLAFWGLLTVAATSLAFWPLLVDPQRADRGALQAARLAALLVVAHPVRSGVLTVLLSVILILSVVLFAAFLTIGIAFVQSVACHYVLPAADRLEYRLNPASAAGTLATPTADE